MSLERTVYGVILLRADPGIAEAVNALRAEINDTGCNLTLECGPDGIVFPYEWELLIDSSTTSGWTSDRIDKAIPAFAAKWAREPATLDTGCEGDQDDWFVGPAGFDELSYEIEVITHRIEALEQQRQGLLNERRERDGL